MRLSRSFLTAIGLLTLLHAYIGLRLLPDLPVGDAVRAFGVVLLAFSGATVPLGVMSRSARRPAWSDHLKLTGLLMMGLFSSLLVFTVLRDVALLAALWVVPTIEREAVTQASAVIAAALAGFATLVGFMNARRRARVVTVEIPLPNLPEALHGFSIVQISDIHVGPTIRRPYVEAIVNAVNGLKADLVAVTGDLVDGGVEELAEHVEPLARLSAVHGAYFVTGNHEYYSGERAWTREFTRLGLRVLKNEHVVLEHRGVKLVVAGVTDFSAHQFNPAERSDPGAALQGAPQDAGAKLLLAHQPRSAFAAAAAGFDLQISGHTHGGQFWPWTLFVRFQQPFTAGLHRLDGMLVYTSRGTGYWGPPKRFGAPSEITVLRLVRAS